jgi:hypothetical protein
VVFFEIEQCVWIVDQYIRIKHIKDWLVGRRVTSMIIHTRSPFVGASRRNTWAVLRLDSTTECT